MSGVQFTEVRKTFGLRTGRRTEALVGVTLDIEAGESIAVVGPNGAGKSTLLALVLGFLRPTDGELAIGGRIPVDWVRRHGAGWLPERFQLPAEWTVAMALLALASLEGGSSGARGKVAATLERWGLAPHAKRSVGALSRGLLQRLGIAQATIANRSLVILDEPTNALDPDGRRLFRDAVAELRNGGATLLIASHDLTELERVADRAIVLEAGRVRDVIEVAPPAAGTRWMLRTSAPDVVVNEIFPDATRPPGTKEPGGSADWLVTVEGVESLNAGLARLIAAGGLVVEVAPSTPTLEERIGRSDTDGNDET